jgi:hypothetical protein
MCNAGFPPCDLEFVISLSPIKVSMKENKRKKQMERMEGRAQFMVLEEFALSGGAQSKLWAAAAIG